MVPVVVPSAALAASVSRLMAAKVGAPIPALKLVLYAGPFLASACFSTLMESASSYVAVPTFLVGPPAPIASPVRPLSTGPSKAIRPTVIEESAPSVPKAVVAVSPLA